MLFCICIYLKIMLSVRVKLRIGESNLLQVEVLPSLAKIQMPKQQKVKIGFGIFYIIPKQSYFKFSTLLTQ